MERKPAETMPPETGEAEAGEAETGEAAGFDRLPERLRRWQRFGGAEAAALAEAEALRREIDALAARLARAAASGHGAGGRGGDRRRQEELQHMPAGADEFPVTGPESPDAAESLRAWLALRRAGLAVSDAIARLGPPRRTATE